MKRIVSARVVATPGARRLARLNGIRAERIPIAMQMAAVPFEWDRDRLWGLNKPVSLLPAAELEWHLDVPFWAQDGAPFRVTPNQVRARPELHQDQFRRTLDADLNHPLVVMRWRRRWTILDGVHRLLKTRLVGLDPVPVRILDPSDIGQVVRQVRRNVPAVLEHPI
jgi:hypothetical protein